MLVQAERHDSAVYAVREEVPPDPGGELAPNTDTLVSHTNLAERSPSHRRAKATTSGSWVILWVQRIPGKLTFGG
jgi:hypothetical protein